MADDRIKILEERLMRLENLLTQQPSAGRPGGFTQPGGTVVDPAPFPVNWGYPRRPFPTPVVDPAPWPYWGHHWPPQVVVDPAPWPNPIADPAPTPWPNPVVDPAPTFNPRAGFVASFGRIGPIGDPPPIDISRFTHAQLEATLHTINAERARLDSMETMIRQQLDNLSQKGEI